jgi:hypothetical protein
VAAKGALLKDFKTVFEPFVPSPAVQSRRILRFLSGMLIGD